MVPQRSCLPWRGTNVFAYNKYQHVKQSFDGNLCCGIRQRQTPWRAERHRDQKSAFGVRPNEDLHGIKQPKRRLTSRKKSAGIDDTNDLDVICHPRIGGVRFEHDAGGFVLDVLGVLGLVRYASNGDEVVTPKLRKQIAVSGVTENEAK
jgi:hypothetical protein